MPLNFWLPIACSAQFNEKKLVSPQKKVPPFADVDAAVSLATDLDCDSNLAGSDGFSGQGVGLGAAVHQASSLAATGAGCSISSLGAASA